MITLTDKMKKQGWMINHAGLERKNSDGFRSVIITRWDRIARVAMFSLWIFADRDKSTHEGIF